MTLRRRLRVPGASLLAAACAIALGLAAPVASAAPTVTEFDVPTADGQPFDITQGPDGNLWYVEMNAPKVGRVVPGDPPAITDFDTPDQPGNPGLPVNQLQGIAAGPDGNLWITGGNNVAKVPPGNPTGGTAYGGLGLISPRGIAAGPDGNLWVVDSGTDDVKRVSPAGAAVGLLPISVGAGCGARNITRGPDDNMWVTCFGNAKIVRIRGDASAADPFDLAAGSTPWDIVAGPDGKLWFTGQKHDVGTITTAGAPTGFTSVGLDPFGITLGPDGALWYAEFGDSTIGRVTTAGVTSQVGGLTANAGPRYIAPGPSNTLWFTEQTANKIGRITGIEVPGGGGQPGGDTIAPAVSNPKVSPKNVIVGAGATPVRLGRRRGTTISYTLSEQARVSLRIERVLPGRRSGRRCVKLRRALRKKRRCTRHVRAGTLERSGRKGRNTVSFSGRIGRRALVRGRYRLTVTATDPAGNLSKPKRTSFRIVRPKQR
jgi:virginiamycin B lyase